jgi:hypothetical protein
MLTQREKIDFLKAILGDRTQCFLPKMAPGVMRFVRVATAEPGRPRNSVRELLEAFG